MIALYIVSSHFLSLHHHSGFHRQYLTRTLTNLAFLLSLLYYIKSWNHAAGHWQGFV